MSSSIIEKSVSLLEHIGAASKPLTFTEVVNASGFNKSTVHRLLVILMAEGLVQFDPQRKTYLLGRRLLDLAKKAWKGYDIQVMALDEMLKLNAKYNENVTIGVLDGHEVAYLRWLEADYSWDGMQRPNSREPVHCSATGKAMMAFLADPIIEAWMERHEFTLFTDQTITTAAGFREELKRVRERGFAINDREQYEFSSGIAVPILNYMGEPIAAMNIFALTHRHSLSDLMEWVDDLKAAGRQVSDLIGGTLPQS